MKWAKRLLAAVAAFYFVGACWAYFHSPEIEVTTQEVVPPGEEEVILRLVRKATLALDGHAKADRFYKRDAHPVPHGCVRAHFTVLEDLDERLQHGIFDTPGQKYQAWIRFSNALKSDDTSTDGRGMAIKVMGVGNESRGTPRHGDSQDFLMVNGAEFFNRDVFEYEEFFDYQMMGPEYQILYFTGANPFRWRLTQLETALRMTIRSIGSPLAEQYHSSAPYRFGPHNAKFSAKACASTESDTACEAFELEQPNDPGPHFLRDAMIAHLDERPARFDLLFQLQDASKPMPIEDPTVPWREEDSAFLPVARIDIPAQQFSSDTQNQFCEQLSFAPWQGFKAHRPLGGINRARKAVYQAVSQRRHARNGYERNEPRGWCLELSGQECRAGEDYFFDRGSRE